MIVIKNVSLFVCAFLLSAISVFGQALTPADRDRGIQYLEETRNGVVAATKGLSESQMKFKPGPDRWSVAETLEHIALAEEFILNNVKDNIMKAPPGPADRDIAKTDAMVRAMVPDRSHKAQA